MGSTPQLFASISVTTKNYHIFIHWGSLCFAAIASWGVWGVDPNRQHVENIRGSLLKRVVVHRAIIYHRYYTTSTILSLFYYKYITLHLTTFFVEPNTHESPCWTKSSVAKIWLGSGGNKKSAGELSRTGRERFPNLVPHDGSMGRTVYLPTWIADFYGFHVGKYTVRPMDPMGYGTPTIWRCISYWIMLVFEGCFLDVCVAHDVWILGLV